MARKQTPPPAGSRLDRFSPLQLDLLSVAFLYLLTLILFRGIVFQDAVFSTEGDTMAAEAYRKAGDHIRDTENIDPLWMPYVFSGMPTFGNVAYLPHNVSYLQVAALEVFRFLFLNSSVAWMIVHYFIGGVFMLFLMRTLGLGRLPALFAAVTFMLSPYAIGLAQEGHGSKLQALSYLPMVFLLTHQLLEKRSMLWFGLFAAGIGTLLLTNHMQIVYYVFLVIGLYTLAGVVRDMRTERMLAVKKGGLLAAGLVVGLCISAYIYLSVYEYSHYSIRGGGAAGVPGGLTWDYATNWSFHPAELMTFLIPSFFGFSSAYPYSWQGQVTPLPLYWGSMPFCTSTVYIGLLPVLLAGFALVYRRNRLTLFFAALTLLIVLMSFGKHFGLFYGLLFNVLPFFDKFRAPVMILHLAAFTGAALGGIGLGVVLEKAAEKDSADRTAFRTFLLWALGILWGLLVLGLLFREGISAALAGTLFEKPGESYPPQVIAELKKIRYELLWNDYVRFVLLATAGLGAVLLLYLRKMRVQMFGAVILGILMLDLFLVDAKFINPQKPKATADLQPDATTRYLQADPGLFRIFPLAELFMEKSYMYHTLQSIGGYHPAKLRIYQTMIDSCLYRGADPSFPLNMNVVNMLNTRYLLATGQLPADRFEPANIDEAKKIFTYRNPGALPRAFFTRTAVVARNQTDVFARMNDPAWNPAETAILETDAPPPIGEADSTSAVVTEYGAHRIVVDAFTTAPGLLVLSEVYYPAGWKATVDGAETPILKTNYVLRSVAVPPGRHRVEFTFAPAMVDLGWALSHAAWGVAGICVLAGLWRLPSVRSRIGGRRPDRTTPA